MISGLTDGSSECSSHTSSSTTCYKVPKVGMERYMQRGGEGVDKIRMEKEREREKEVQK